MTGSHLIGPLVAGALGDVAIVYLSWRYIVRPKLDRYIRRIAREELSTPGLSK
jgi:hypothetical protein